MTFTPVDLFDAPGIGFSRAHTKNTIVPHDNTSAALQEAHDFCLEKGYHLDLKGARYNISTGVRFNTASVNINANAAIFDATNMTGLFALQTDSIATESMFGAKTHSIYNLEIIGPVGVPSSSGVTGLLVSGSAPSRSPRPTFFGLHIEGFGIGADFKDFAYLSQFYGFESRSAGISIRQSVGNDSGENISFHGGGLYNATECCIQMFDESSEFNLHSMSLDYSPKFVDQRAGRLNLFAPHIENNAAGWTTDAIYVTGDGSCLTSYGGYLVSAGGQPSGVAQLINVADSRSAAFFHGIQPQNLGNSLNKLGTGNVYFRDTRIYANGINVNPTRITDSFSQLIDGSFEASTFPRDRWSLITDSVGPATSRVTGANGTLALSSTVARPGGTKSLRVNKTATGAFVYVVLVRLNGSTGPISGQFYQTAVAGTPLTGAATLWEAGFTIVNGNDSNLVPVVPFYTTVASNTFTPTVGTWNNVNVRVPGYVPTWATDFFIRFTLPAANTGDLFLDDASIHQW